GISGSEQCDVGRVHRSVLGLVGHVFALEIRAMAARATKDVDEPPAMRNLGGLRLIIRAFERKLRSPSRLLRMLALLASACEQQQRDPPITHALAPGPA